MHGNNLFSTFSEPPEGEWWENPFVIKGGERIAKEKKVAVVSKSHADVIVSRHEKSLEIGFSSWKPSVDRISSLEFLIS